MTKCEKVFNNRTEARRKPTSVNMIYQGTDKEDIDVKGTHMGTYKRISPLVLNKKCRHQNT